MVIDLTELLDGTVHDDILMYQAAGVGVHGVDGWISACPVPQGGASQARRMLVESSWEAGVLGEGVRGWNAG